jgi:hypothetical protein
LLGSPVYLNKTLKKIWNFESGVQLETSEGTVNKYGRFSDSIVAFNWFE